jgi:hypothetical protein
VLLTNTLIRDYLLNYARPLIYTTSLSNLAVIAASCSFDLLEDGTADRVGVAHLSLQPRTHTTGRVIARDAGSRPLDILPGALPCLSRRVVHPAAYSLSPDLPPAALEDPTPDADHTPLDTSCARVVRTPPNTRHQRTSDKLAHSPEGHRSRTRMSPRGKHAC